MFEYITTNLRFYIAFWQNMFTKYKKVKGEQKCPSPNKIMVAKHFSNSHKIKTGAYAGIVQFVQILDISNLRVTKAFQQILCFKEELLLCQTIYVLSYSKFSEDIQET